jgi:hypothetical protein
MTLRKPNLFIIGAMKSGTTYLAKLLEAHPHIFICRPEEPSYFVESQQLRTLYPKIWDLGYWKSEDRYLRLFEAAVTATVIGEASTNYTKLPIVRGVPEKIRKFNPDARFIYILRDPIERTISHYWHMVRYHAERRPILAAVNEDPHYRDVSHYAMQLTAFFECFDRKQIRILTFEELTRKPNEMMQDICNWLEINPLLNEPSAVRAEHVTPQIVKMATGYGMLRWLRQSRALRPVIPYVPHVIRRFGVQFAERAIDRQSIDTSEVASFLRPIQIKQTEELSRLLGRGFPEWVTLYQNTVNDAGQDGIRTRFAFSEAQGSPSLKTAADS